ncbi:MAG: fructose-1,6-bisphosphatase [Clostridia bacterium]|nr:fructose-1,6-bisphosphatase [Clostridia bacterium]
MENFGIEEKYFSELSRRYPTRASVVNEIAGLNAVLNLPKGTEHFISDIHGEHEAFSHILRCASGVIGRKLRSLFGGEMDEEEISELATVIFYPREKLSDLALSGRISEEWYYRTLERMVSLSKLAAEKYTSLWVKEKIADVTDGYSHIIEELIYADATDGKKREYYKSIYKTVVRMGYADGVICALASTIKALMLDRLHIVGDIFDRGARADIILDELIAQRCVDVEWGNHDALWLGAAAGSAVCVATVLNNSLSYKNLDVLEIGYGISLRPLEQFAERTYSGLDASIYMPKGDGDGDIHFNDSNLNIAKMRKAISVIQFKLEGQAIIRNPDFEMEDRLLLDRIDPERCVIKIDGREHKIRDGFFPTVNFDQPYELSEGEAEIMKYLVASFGASGKLSRHAKFLYESGGMYKVFNRNLIFHGSIPLTSDGRFMKLRAAEGLSGRALMDYFDKWARLGYFSPEGTQERARGRDILWFLWCGRNSPLCAREKIATFEGLLIEDKSTHIEPRNAYYNAWRTPEVADMILAEFSLSGPRCHIINGHIPVNKGENPIKADGRVIVIDGGFCKAYHDTTGIAGYTLIYNADGMKISAHEPFTDKMTAIKYNRDILSQTTVFEQAKSKILIRDCDEGKEIRDNIAELILLLQKYERGEIKENSK